MIYNVFGGTLSLTQSLNLSPLRTCLCMSLLYSLSLNLDNFRDPPGCKLGTPRATRLRHYSRPLTAYGSAKEISSLDPLFCCNKLASVMQHTEQTYNDGNGNRCRLRYCTEVCSQCSHTEIMVNRSHATPHYQLAERRLTVNDEQFNKQHVVF